MKHNENSTGIMSFDEVWEKYIIPLQGKVLTNENIENTILKVDNKGITRVSSKGNINRIGIENFREAYELLISKGSVERGEIHQLVGNRCSSGIVLVLSQVPFIGVRQKPITIYIKNE